MRILLLEDSSTDAELAQRSLTRSIPGCIISIAPTLKDARSLIKNGEGFDVALLDMALPDGNGQELLSEIRQSGIDMAVVMLTGSGNEEVAVAALKAGADDYVIKRQGYISHLSMTIHFAIENYKHNKQLRTDLLRLLYIEHNTSDLDLMVRHLRQYSPNIVVETVVTAEEALLILPRDAAPGKYQVILMDYRLPGLNALEFIKIIRQERNSDIPIILVSGQGNEDIAVQALKLGASEYLVKRENYLFRLPTLITSAYQHYELKRSQIALKESESKYRLIAENSGDVIFVLNKEMKYSYVSPAIKGLRGYEVDEVMDHTLSQVFTPDSYMLAMEAITEFFLNSSILQDRIELEKTLELEMTCKDGSTVWTEVKGKLISDENGQPSGIVGVTRDISKRRKATSELRKLSRAVDQSPNSIVISAVDGKIEYVNPITFKLSGYLPEELIGKTSRIFSSGETPKEEYKILWDTILSGKEWEGEFHNRKKNGELYWESATISPIIDEKGKIIHFLAIKKDITESKKLAVELIAAKEHAEESDRLKSSFLANMSHEIRTPLNSIIGFSELLGDDYFDQHQKKEFILNIIINGNNLLNIISDIMDISKIEAGQITIRKMEIQVKKILEEIRAQYITKAGEKSLTFRNNCYCNESGSDVFVLADPERLRQIFNNLISNALKFTSEGYIEIGCWSESDWVEFYVKDTGIGIPSEFHAVIFDHFRQVESERTRTYGGNGLGLAITKNLVELMGGKIWVESEKGKGSTFYFSLPIK